MMSSRKRTNTRKVAIGVIGVCKSLAALEDALTGIRGYTPGAASPPIVIMSHFMHTDGQKQEMQ